MESRIVRKMFLGFINIHILHHADREPFYGSWMIGELGHHGYAMSAGTLYPILHGLLKEGLLACESRVVEGKVRKYYSATDSGREVLANTRAQAYELFREIREPATAAETAR